MAVRRSDKGISTPAEPGAMVVARRSSVARLAILIGAVTHLAGRCGGVRLGPAQADRDAVLAARVSSAAADAKYTLDGSFPYPKGQQPCHRRSPPPDLVARTATIQMRIKLDGSVEVTGRRARGPASRTLVGARSAGPARKLPRAERQAVQVPSLALDIADSTIALATPWAGRRGASWQRQSARRLQGPVALISPRLIPAAAADA